MLFQKDKLCQFWTHNSLENICLMRETCEEVTTCSDMNHVDENSCVGSPHDCVWWAASQGCHNRVGSCSGFNKVDCGKNFNPGFCNYDGARGCFEVTKCADLHHRIDIF